MMTVIKPQNFDTHKFIQIESTAIDLTCPGVSRIDEKKKDIDLSSTNVSKIEGDKEEEEEGSEDEDELFPPVRTWKRLKKHGMERMLLPDGWSLRQWSNGHNRDGDDHVKVLIIRNFKKDNPGKLVQIPEGYDLRLVKSRQPTCSRCNNHPEHPSVDGRKMKLKGHKKFCPLKDCTCNKCILVDKRRDIMAKQVANRRNQAHIQEAKNSVGKGEKNERKNIEECERVEEGRCSSEKKDFTPNSIPIESGKKKHQIMAPAPPIEEKIIKRGKVVASSGYESCSQTESSPDKSSYKSRSASPDERTGSDSQTLPNQPFPVPQQFSPDTFNAMIHLSQISPLFQIGDPRFMNQCLSAMHAYGRSFLRES